MLTKYALLLRDIEEDLEKFSVAYKNESIVPIPIGFIIDWQVKVRTIAGNDREGAVENV